MSSKHNHGNNDRSSFTNNYASRILSRVLNERKKTDTAKLTTADAAKYAVPAETEAKATASSAAKV